MRNTLADDIEDYLNTNRIEGIDASSTVHAVYRVDAKQMMSKNIQLVLMAIIILVLVWGSFNTVEAATILVPEDYPTIQAAIDAANSGDMIIVQSGIYQESILINKAIRLIAENFDSDDPVNNTTFIEAAGSDNAPYTILVESGISGEVAIQGFVISGGDDLISAASTISIEYNYFHSGNDLVDTELGAGGVIRGNVFVDAGDDAIDIDDAVYPLAIEGNRIYSSHDDGIEIRLQASSAPDEQIAIVIINNQIIANNRTGIQLIDYIADPQDTNRYFIVTGNLFARNRLVAIGFMGDENSSEDLSGADIIEPVYTYNNTFYENAYALSGGDNHVVFNNIFANNEVAVSRVAGNQNDDSVVAYNLFYENLNHNIDSVIGIGNIYDQNPQFEYLPNPGIDEKWGTVDDDFAGLILQEGSPAIDVGLKQFITNNGTFVPTLPIEEFDGLVPDLGWKEFFF